MSDERLFFANIHQATYVFLLVNPTSGGNSATALLQPHFNFLQFFHKHQLVKLYTADIRKGPPGAKYAFQILQAVIQHKLQQASVLDDVFVLVAGGDGTAMWAISELAGHGIDAQNVKIGIIPFGTGNDFACAMGSKAPDLSECTTDPESMVKRLISSSLDFESAHFDLWKVEVSLQENGIVRKIDGKSRLKTVVTDPATEKPVNSLKLSMLNYFSIGVESRIGIGFDRNRTTNQILNKGTYALEGLKKLAFHRRRYVNNLITGLSLQESPNEPPQTVFRSHRTLTRTEKLVSYFNPPKGREIPIKKSQTQVHLYQKSPTSISERGADSDAGVESDTSEDDDEKNHCDYPLLKPSVSLMFLNIPSFAGGLDPWAAALGKLGVKLPEDRSLEPIEEELKLTMTDESKQDFGDGKLELVAFHSLMELSLANIGRFVSPRMGPFGWRICRGGGRFVIPFRKSLTGDDRIYFQVDGEYFTAVRVRE